MCLKLWLAAAVLGASGCESGMGGTAAAPPTKPPLVTAQAESTLAEVAFSRQQRAEANELKAPVLLLRGDVDAKFGAEKPPTIVERFERNGQELEFLQVSGGHAFSDPTRPDYSAKGNEVAFSRVRSFLRRQLRN